jgi:hypothetical protein
MKKELKSFWSLGALAMILGVGVSLNAQQTTPPATTTDPAATAPQTQSSDPATTPTQPGDPTAQQPATTPQTQTNQTPEQQPSQSAPDTQGQATPSATDAQSFSGTIVKAGDKYVLQDADAGKTYDIDHQDQVKQYEGKKVRVHGTLDASGKMIHVQ